MIEGHIIFNAILYSIVIAYILYINFSAYYQTGTGFLRALVNLFQNWIFRTVYLLIVGFFALDLFPYGGFVLAILLTIAFLNTNMLVYKKDVEESLSMRGEEDDEKNKLPTDVLPTDIPIQNQTQMESSTPTYQPPSSSSVQSNPSMIAPTAPSQPQQQQQYQAPQQQQQQQPQQPQQPQQQQQQQRQQQQVVQQNPQQPMQMSSSPRQM